MVRKLKKTKVNKKAKGNRAELIARTKLNADGWLVHDKPKKAAWIGGRQMLIDADFFGLFDLIAIKGAMTKFVQVKTNRSHFYTARKEISKWLASYKLEIPTEVWLLEDNGEWRQEVILPSKES